MGPAVAIAAAAGLALAACGSPAEPPVAPAPTTPVPATTAVVTAAPPPEAARPPTEVTGPGPEVTVPPVTGPPAATPAPAPVEVRYRIERRTVDQGTEGFEHVVRATLADPRGWTGGGFTLLEDTAAPYLVVLAEGDEVDQLCAPYDTGGRYSCQNGPVVALNADRWRTATPEWTGTLADYRQMLVNHEVGHLLGRHHPPPPQCPVPGRPARVMSQQSTELDGCLPNPWPVAAELTAAARHDEPLAPPYEG